MIGEKIDRSSWFDRYTWVEFNADTDSAKCFYCKLFKTVASKNDEFRAGNVRNWRTFIERANPHQEPNQSVNQSINQSINNRLMARKLPAVKSRN